VDARRPRPLAAFKGLRRPPASELEVRRGRRSVLLTRLDRPLFRDEGIARGDLVDYYRAVAPVLLPHLRGRPFTIKRYYTVVGGPCVWEKDAPEEAPSWIRTCPLEARSRAGEAKTTVDYPVLDDELALLWMLEYGCVDLHVWTSRCDRADRPDYVLFDLDPAAGAGFAETAAAARLLREALQALELESFVKTSGGAGLHVLVPVARRYDHGQTGRFASLLAQTLARAAPELVTTERVASRRRGVFVDAKLNGRGMTIVSAYSVRPRAGAPVSAPLAWEELTDELDPRSLTMPVVAERVAEGDPLAPVLRLRQPLDRALAAAGALTRGAAAL
jgi:bifunctional non-homologous end joining protein LigD